MSTYVVVPVSEISSPRRPSIAYLLWLAGLFGLCGLHRWYCGRRVSAVVWFVTLGLCGVGQLVDWLLVAGMVRKANLPRLHHRSLGQPR